MVNIQPNTPDRKSDSKCRRCGRVIHWRKSERTGKSYPIDDPANKTSFHQCPNQSSASPIVNVEGQPKPTPTPKPITPDYFEATLEQRVESLEKQVAALVRTVREVESRQPITGQDVGF